MSILDNYNKFILNPTPSKLWKVLRFILHWVTIPIKLTVIGALGLYGVIYHIIVSKNRIVEMPKLNLADQKHCVKKTMDFLPVFKNDQYELYVNRVPFYQGIDGSNQNIDHQCLRQGLYTFLKQKTGSVNDETYRALHTHILGQKLFRGYKTHPYDGQMIANEQTVSGDMLLGLCLAMVNTTDFYLKEKFDVLLAGIIENDYALMEGATPEDGPERELWNELLTQVKASELVKMKSARANWQPGLETVGAQALTLLAALRVGDKVIGASYAKKEYRKMLWLYGYGLLSLIPTAFIPSRRGYFNDANCINALYILSSLSDSKLGKLFWKLPMLYVWLLSYKWYNGYFTGMIEDAHPGTIKKSYLEKCKDYLYDQEPQGFTFINTTPVSNLTVPVTANFLQYDEFNYECPQNQSFDVVNATDQNKVKTGLGFLAAAIMLEGKNAKDLF